MPFYDHRVRLSALKGLRGRAAELALGKPVMEAYLISAAALSEFFGGLEQESIHCAQMAEIALKRTLKDYAGPQGGPDGADERRGDGRGGCPEVKPPNP